MVTLLIVGTGLQVLGFGLAVRGFYRTWREHGRGQDFWEPWKKVGRRVGRRMRNLVWWRKPRPVEVTMSGVLPALEGKFSATVSWGPLPDPSEDLAAFAATVHERLNRANSIAQANEQALIREREAREKAQKRIRETLSTEIDRVEELARHVAVGGLRWEVVGWVMLLVGLIFVGIGSIGLAVQA